MTSSNAKLSLKVLIAILLISSCSPARLPPTSTFSPLPTDTSTQTPIWFPPTATRTLIPTSPPEPTPDLHPGVGERLLSDDFSDEAVWEIVQLANSSMMMANQRLTLATQNSTVPLLNRRSGPIFGDFYAEITASPSLCSGEDEYGFVIRAASSGDHYRFTLSCDGRAKVDRVLNGALSTQVGWLQSTAIPGVAPSNSRMSVWASGSEMRFFIDDAYLFTINDTVIYTGTVGVFIRARGANDLSVSFSDLQVWALQE